MSMPNDQQTLTVYARVAFTDSTGLHQRGEAVQVPYATDAQKAEVLGMVSYGVISLERLPN